MKGTDRDYTGETLPDVKKKDSKSIKVYKNYWNRKEFLYTTRSQIILIHTTLVRVGHLESRLRPLKYIVDLLGTVRRCWVIQSRWILSGSSTIKTDGLRAILLVYLLLLHYITSFVSRTVRRPGVSRGYRHRCSWTQGPEGWYQSNETSPLS